MSRVIRPVRNLQKKRHTRRLGDIGGSGVRRLYGNFLIQQRTLVSNKPPETVRFCSLFIREFRPK